MRSPESDFRNLPFILSVVTYLCLLNIILVFELSLDIPLFNKEGSFPLFFVSSLVINVVWAMNTGNRKLPDMVICFFLYVVSFCFLRDVHFWNYYPKEEVAVGFKMTSIVFMSEYFYYVIFLSFLNSLNHKSSSYFDFYNLFCLSAATLVIDGSTYTSFDSVFIRLVFSIVTYQIYNFLLQKLVRRRRSAQMKSEIKKVVLL